jgi:hypothetical protein
MTEELVDRIYNASWIPACAGMTGFDFDALEKV